MEEHAVHQKFLHVLQDGLVTIVNKVRKDVGMSDIIYVIIFKTSMNVMVIMSVIMSVLTMMDLLCVHVMMVTCHKDDGRTSEGTYLLPLHMYMHADGI